MDRAVGDVVAGLYQVLQVHGQGGMGLVQPHGPSGADRPAVPHLTPTSAGPVAPPGDSRHMRVQRFLELVERAPGRTTAAGLGLVVAGARGHGAAAALADPRGGRRHGGHLLFGFGVDELAGERSGMLLVPALTIGMCLAVTFGLLVHRIVLTTFGQEVTCAVTDRRRQDD